MIIIHLFLTRRSRFRWVALQLDAVSKCYTMNSLRATLSSLPSTLDETYTRILDNIDEVHRPRIYRILQCVCFSRRPLRVEELAAIFQLGDHAQPQFHIDDDAPFFPDHILDLCSGLLLMSVVKPSRHGSWNWYTNGILDHSVVFHTVQVSHFSVKEYLISPRASFWHLDENQSHLAILQMVTTYYILVASMPDVCSLSRQDLIIKHSLAAYAAIYTRQHLGSLEPREHPDLLYSFQPLLNPDSALLCNPIGSFYCYNKSPPFHVFPQAYAPALSLHVAAFLSLPQISEWLLTFDICRDQLLSSLPFPGLTPPLSVAATFGRLDVVKVLLGAGANTYESMGEAICYAARFKHTKVLEVLIEAGGNPYTGQSKPSSGGSALRIAISRGRDDIVSMLLNSGADVNGGDWQRWGSPIQAAATNMMWGTVEKLIDAGANVDLPGVDNSTGTALYSAAYRGHDDMVQMLFDAGANVDILGGFYGSAIQAASYRGHYNIVALLIQSGANVNVRGIVHRKVQDMDWWPLESDQREQPGLSRYQSALSIAREQKFDEIVELLEDAGATDFCDVVDEVD
jgi:ankyrin repeat protein